MNAFVSWKIPFENGKILMSDRRFSPPTSIFSDAADPFYEDAELKEMLGLERLLRDAEKEGFALLRLLLSRKTEDEMAELLFLSNNSVKYRFKRMKKLCGMQCKNDLVFLIHKYQIVLPEL